MTRLGGSAHIGLGRRASEALSVGWRQAFTRPSEPLTSILLLWRAGLSSRRYQVVGDGVRVDVGDRLFLGFGTPASRAMRLWFSLQIGGVVGLGDCYRSLSALFSFLTTSALPLCFCYYCAHWRPPAVFLALSFSHRMSVSKAMLCFSSASLRAVSSASFWRPARP
ncbi:hypothetical protein B0H14DRAFT_3444633 [Mycena olivaceomarginata]|nr:hypothetical protein B0H14DRAFT_3444633 [Mycena olivaceomarginata]